MKSGPGSVARYIHKRQEAVMSDLRNGFPPEFTADRVEVDLVNSVVEYIRMYGRHMMMQVVIDAADEADAMESRR